MISPSYTMEESGRLNNFAIEPEVYVDIFWIEQVK